MGGGAKCSGGHANKEEGGHVIDKATGSRKNRPQLSLWKDTVTGDKGGGGGEQTKCPSGRVEILKGDDGTD